jgi:hypothetical protein
LPEVCSWDPFASDTLLEKEIRRLIGKYGIQSAVETGTFLGVTAQGLAAMVPSVYTIEVRQDRYEQARENLAGLPNVEQILGASPDVFPGLIPRIKKPALYYLDAHWDDHYPLPEEVAIIAEHDPAPVIVMHDMQVPGHPELHADPQPDGSFYDFEWVRPGLEKIQSPWRYYYNDQGAEGMKIGIMFVTPA